MEEELQLPDTVPECHAVIRQLMSIVNKLTAEVEVLKAEVAELKRENADLKERLNQNSNNSSLPPSQGFKANKKKVTTKKAGTGRRSGGQTGHKGSHRALLPTSEVDVINHCPLPEQCDCGGKLKKQGKIFRWQVHELPEIKLHTTEYQCEKGRCTSCRRRYTAPLPNQAQGSIIGPRLMSFLSLLPAKYHISRRLAVSLLKEVFQFDISLGTLFNKEKKITQMTSPVCDEVLERIKEGDFIHADETGMRESGKNGWLWSFSNSQCTYFSAQASRGKKVLEKLLGDYDGIVISDRYSAYNRYDDDRRQLCWAHLTRDFRRISENAQENIARTGGQLLEEKEKLFNYWHAFKAKQITREQLQRYCDPITRQVENLLMAIALTAPELRAAGTCKNILKHSDALWTFLREESIEPTNNHAEQQLRPEVIWRKISFGSKSCEGSLFISNIATVVATCKKQSLDTWQFLQNMITAAVNNLECPRLLSSNCPG